MAIEKSTLAILKNFAQINPNVVYDGNGKIKTISEAKNILAEAEVEGLGKISVYDLNEFFSVISLVDDGSITYEEGKCIISNDAGYKVTYTFADPNILTSPQKDITMPSVDAEFVIRGSELASVRKAASTLGHNVLRFTNSDKGVAASVIDSTGASKNDYSFVLEVVNDVDTTSTFSFDVLINNLKLLDGHGDYMVKLSSKLISKWEGGCYDKKVNYFIALESTSTYAG